MLPGVVIAEFAEDDRAHGGAFCGGVWLPVETKALTTDATLNVLTKIRPPDQNLHGVTSLAGNRPHFLDASNIFTVDGSSTHSNSTDVE
jgi:hypothetical protein